MSQQWNYCPGTFDIKFMGQYDVWQFLKYKDNLFNNKYEINTVVTYI